MWVPKWRSISRKTLMSLSCMTKFIATPDFPNRPVRPIRCRYVSQSALPDMSTGISKLTTKVTCSTSIPREHTFVVTSTRSLASLNLNKFVNSQTNFCTEVNNKLASLQNRSVLELMARPLLKRQTRVRF